MNKVVHPPTPTDLRRFTRGEREFLEEENGRLRDQVVDAQRVWDLATYNTKTMRDATL